MKVLIITLCLLTAISLQAECEYLKNETDSFTKEVVKITTFEPLFNSYKDITLWQGSMVNAGGTKGIYLMATIKSAIHGREIVGHIRTGNRIMLKFDDDSVITANMAKDDIGDFKRNLGLTHYTTMVMLTKELEQKLEKNKLTSIRVYWTEGFMDYEIDNQDVFMKQVGCIK